MLNQASLKIAILTLSSPRLGSQTRYFLNVIPNRGIFIALWKNLMPQKISLALA